MLEKYEVPWINKEVNIKISKEANTKIEFKEKLISNIYIYGNMMH